VNPKGIIKILLLVFVVLCIGFLAYKEFRSDPKGAGQTLAGNIAGSPVIANAAEGTGAKQPAQQSIAYYFHTTYRCPTCLKIEEYTKQAIMEAFPGELNDGRLIWKSVNVEEKSNEHFIKEYQLFSKAVVIVDMKEGKQVRWKNLKDIWQLVGTRDTFTRYIQDEIRSYLGKS
jgi:hypothetical protein